ncbi:uncharacterized protein LOC125387111 [Bombus terrestris]|uniref:Uncharacterized protein LOC125387111 n=1 Tax=Bombus terrestris TaxID=30195 RepID=A0A9C6T0A4_BOMTE|nr:uncharacterized protein LOC125387111 [Bombus terrestris]
MHKDDGKNRVVEYYSKKTSSAESRYHSYDIETLAVVNAVKRYHHYLHGREFIVATNCNSMKVIVIPSNKLNLDDKVIQIVGLLRKFNFDVMYREGKHVDFHSRNSIYTTGKLSGQSDLKEYVIVLVDVFTKFVYLYHVRKIDYLGIIKALKSPIFFSAVLAG